MNNSSPVSNNQFCIAITPLLNAWLYLRLPHESYTTKMLEEEISNFLQLPLNTLFVLANKKLLTELPADHPVYITADEVEAKLKNTATTTLTEICLQAAVFKSRETEALQKTNLRKWILQKRKEGVISTKLRSTLESSGYNWEYLEDVNETQFRRCRNAGNATWQEFIRLTGW